nr:arylesterase [Sphingosinicella flava]
MSRSLNIFAALFALHLVSACSDRQEPNAPAREKKVSETKGAVERAPLAPDQKLVLAFGDSLYAGYGVPQSESFPHELEEALNADGVKARVYNAGVSGDTTAAGRQRLSFTLDGLPRKPDLVILGLGGNDMLRGLDPDQTRQNLIAILEELKRRDIPVMLTGMVAAPNLGRDFAGSFNGIYPDLAKAYDAPLYPFFLDGVVTDPALMLQDGLHPNERGIDFIVGKVTPLVQRALK